MNNNEITNPKTPTKKGIKPNEKDYLNSFLSCLKEMSKNYVISLTEASNEVLYKKHFAAFQKIIELQREAYELMFRNGWYKLEKAETKKIDKKLKTLDQEFVDLKK